MNVAYWHQYVAYWHQGTACWGSNPTISLAENLDERKTGISFAFALHCRDSKPEMQAQSHEVQATTRKLAFRAISLNKIDGENFDDFAQIFGKKMNLICQKKQKTTTYTVSTTGWARKIGYPPKLTVALPSYASAES